MSISTEEIKVRLDIVEFLRGYMRLEKTGINYRGLCPFHGEKTPSFFVSPERQRWHCFGGCSEGGDIFNFIMKIEGLEFVDALKTLAERAGVVLQDENPALRTERNRLLSLTEEATKFFEKQLTANPAACEYLKKRGLSDETIQNFRVGFSPTEWDSLTQFLSLKRFTKQEIEKAGLAIRQPERGTYYDRFRSRIMFPITDGNGHVIAFGGRIFSTVPSEASAKDGAKYINSPQTSLYDKSRTLYGFDKAKQTIRTENSVVIVEGYMDCVMSHQAGIQHTVAVSGTALTDEQLRTLRRLTDTLISSFDTDSAGDSATRRSLSLAAQAGFEQKIAAIDHGKDPADAILEDPEMWQRAVREAKPAILFYFEKAFRDHNPQTPEGKKAISASLLPFINDLVDEIQQAHWIGLLAARLQVPETAIWHELNRRQSQQPASHNQLPTEENLQQKTRSRQELVEERLLALMTILDETARSEEGKRSALNFFTLGNHELYGALLDQSREQTLSSELTERLAALKFQGEILRESLESVHEEFLTNRREFEKLCIREKLEILSQEISQKDREDPVAVASLLQNFRLLSEQLRQLIA